nr:classical arabinogalactan protein 7-like [Aegilops tauschii subsp. strangulata]
MPHLQPSSSPDLRARDPTTASLLAPSSTPEATAPPAIAPEPASRRPTLPFARSEAAAAPPVSPTLPYVPPGHRLPPRQPLICTTAAQERQSNTEAGPPPLPSFLLPSHRTLSTRS